VNVAARVERLAEPGGIWISGIVHEQVRDKLALAYEDRGEQTVKNIARPVLSGDTVERRTPAPQRTQRIPPKYRAPARCRWQVWRSSSQPSLSCSTSFKPQTTCVDSAAGETGAALAEHPVDRAAVHQS
jgi:hypothetical protein